jgi:hypothetical protein
MSFAAQGAAAAVLLIQIFIPVCTSLRLISGVSTFLEMTFLAQHLALCELCFSSFL